MCVVCILLDYGTPRPLCPTLQCAASFDRSSETLPRVQDLNVFKPNPLFRVDLSRHRFAAARRAASPEAQANSTTSESTLMP